MRVSHSSSRAHLVALALLFKIVCFASACRENGFTDGRSFRAQLFERIGASRVFEGRLYGEPYRAYRAVAADGAVSVASLRKAFKFIAEDHRSEAGKLSSLAVLYAMGGDLDRAIRAQLGAIKSNGYEPWMLSDLSVLYLERFRTAHDPLDILRSLNSSSQIEDSPASSLEFRFNRALLLDKCKLYYLAQDAWGKYIDLDANSAWAVEARAHLNLLEVASPETRWRRAQALVENYSDSSPEEADSSDVQLYSKNLLEHAERLIGQWGESWDHGLPQEADRALLSARRIGHRLDLAVGEHMISDTVAIIDRYGSQASKLSALAHNQALFRSALDQDLKGGCRKSLPFLWSSRDGLKNLGSPFYRLAWFRLTLCDYGNSNYAAARQGLEELRSLPGANRYPELRGSLEGTLGLISGIEGDPAASLLGYERALDALGRTNGAKIALISRV